MKDISSWTTFKRWSIGIGIIILLFILISGLFCAILHTILGSNFVTNILMLTVLLYSLILIMLCRKEQTSKKNMVLYVYKTLGRESVTKHLFMSKFDFVMCYIEFFLPILFLVIVSLVSYEIGVFNKDVTNNVISTGVGYILILLFVFTGIIICYKDPIILKREKGSTIDNSIDNSLNRILNTTSVISQIIDGIQIFKMLFTKQIKNTSDVSDNDNARN